MGFFVVPPNSNLCQFTLELFKQINNHIRLTVLIDKTTVLNTTITFLGIFSDTIHNDIVMRLRPDKLHTLRQII